MGFLSQAGSPEAGQPRGIGVVATARALLAEAVLLLDHEPGPSGRRRTEGTDASHAGARDSAVAEPQTPTQLQAQGAEASLPQHTSL